MSFTLLGILNAQAAGAGGAGAYDLLETTVLTSSASSVSFTGLDAYTDYKHLQIRATVREDSTLSGLATFLMYFETRGPNDYSNHVLFGQGSSVVSNDLLNSDDFTFFNNIPRDNTEPIFSPLIVDILDFSSSSKNTTIRALGGGNTAAENLISLFSGLYNNTNPITSITFDGLANISTGSRFSLYGVK